MSRSVRHSIQFIINPISGIGRQKTIETLIAKYLDPNFFQYEISYTQHAGHAFTLASDAVKMGIKTVAVVGGDGSVNEAGRALMGSDSQLLIIPAGSGNGIANHYHIPLNHETLFKELSHWKTIVTDVGLANEIPFFGFCGIGFDAHIAHVFAKGPTRGLRGYMRAVVREFFKYKCPEFTFSGTGTPITPFILSVANVSEYGNRVVIDPNANSGDGELAVCMVGKVNPFQLFRLFLRAKKGNINRSAHYSVFRGKAFSFASKKENILAQIDGEPWIFNANTLKITTSDKYLKLLVP